MINDDDIFKIKNKKKKKSVLESLRKKINKKINKKNNNKPKNDLLLQWIKNIFDKILFYICFVT